MPGANKEKGKKQDNKQNDKKIGDRRTNVEPDILDLRDLIYRPTLLDLKLSMAPPSPSISPILDQGKEGACTGFALSSAINLQNNLRKCDLNSREIFTKLPERVSPRMLYEMAKIHDEWPGEDYAGSSIRGALKGFYQCGACSEKLAPYKPDEKGWRITVERAKDARTTGLGAYYRLQPRINDYHAALNETGVIYVSAKVHPGWLNPEKGKIKKSLEEKGGHAFIIVGYNQEGFLIQNSWGTNWGGFNGHSGIAQWSYDDWADNIMDAWVLRLAVPTPDFFDLSIRAKSDCPEAAFVFGNSGAARHNEIVGHFIHLDDGRLVENGRFPTPLSSIEETCRFFIEDENKDENKDDNKDRPAYEHLLFYVHGGLNGTRHAAKRITQMKTVFKANGIYPIHFIWETGFGEELMSVLQGLYQKSQARVGTGERLSEWGDWIIESIARLPGRAIWREMKRDAERSFEAEEAGGMKAFKALLKANSARKVPMKIHFVGHSAGAILLARLLLARKEHFPDLQIETASLLAPACTIKLFERAYLPSLGSTIKSLIQYNLSGKLEKMDSVGPYNKSLLYLVSNAFERLAPGKKAKPLLGMKKYTKRKKHQEILKSNKAYQLHYTGLKSKISQSTTHDGFDNDPMTLNHILQNVLGMAPKREFTGGDIL